MALSEPQRTPFERIRQVDEDGLEFWSARDLMRVLEYTDWRNFTGVLIKGQIACENSGHDPTDHFVGASKMVSLGSDAKREVEDMHLSRYACYLMCKTPILPKKSSCNGPHISAWKTTLGRRTAVFQVRMSFNAAIPITKANARRNWRLFQCLLPNSAPTQPPTATPANHSGIA